MFDSSFHGWISFCKISSTSAKVQFLRLNRIFGTNKIKFDQTRIKLVKIDLLKIKEKR